MGEVELDTSNMSQADVEKLIKMLPEQFERFYFYVLLSKK
jgi:hypothetical protein